MGRVPALHGRRCGERLEEDRRGAPLRLVLQPTQGPLLPRAPRMYQRLHLEARAKREELRPTSPSAQRRAEGASKALRLADAY